LAAVLDIQDGSQSVIILLYTAILLFRRHQFYDVCDLAGLLCGIFNLEVAILKTVS